MFDLPTHNEVKIVNSLIEELGTHMFYHLEDIPSHSYLTAFKSSLISKNTLKDLEEMTSQGGYDLDRNRPQNYSSGVFSRLQYEDLKKAHTETVVPVTHDDYLNKEKYSSMEEIKSARSRQNIKPMSKRSSKAMLNKKNYSSEKVATNLAYDLLKQEEEAKRLNERWWRNLKLLE